MKPEAALQSQIEKYRSMSGEERLNAAFGLAGDEPEFREKQLCKSPK